MHRYFICFLLICLPLPSYANFGLGPCCSGAPCGIVPCDSACGGQAISQMGTSVSAALNALQSAYQAQTQATNDAQSNVTSLSQGLISTMNNSHLDQLTALDAATLRIEASLAALLPVKERLTDHKVSSLVGILKKYFAASNVSENVRSLGPMSQPVSGEVAPNRAAFLVAMWRRSQQLQAANTSDYYEFQSNSKIVSIGSQSLLIETLLSDLESYESPSAIINSASLTSDEALFYQRLLAYIISAKPQKISGTSVGDEVDEINEKRRVARNTIIYDSLLSVLASRSLTETKEWDGIYDDPLVSGTNEISLSEVMKSEANDRLANAEWWGSVKRLSPNGLSRELTYLKATGNLIKSMEYESKQKASYLTALWYVAKRDNHE